jgi:hypothetical protein
MGVKAAGGVRSYADALRIIEVSADRIGTSTAIEMVKGAPSRASTRLAHSEQLEPRIELDVLPQTIKT